MQMRNTAARLFALAAAIVTFASVDVQSQTAYEHKETRELVELVNSASDLVRKKGENAFTDFRAPGSRWRHEETYIFVIDPDGKMLVHFDPKMEGVDQLELKDVNGKPIIRGLLEAATSRPEKPEGWYHYEWPVPGGILPRWKSSYVRLVTAPSGKNYVVGSGMYNDRMEREFVVDLVKNAVAEIEKRGTEAFKTFHDPKGPFLTKDAYIFVFTMDGVEIVNPAFPSIEGKNNMDVQDRQGKFLTREIIITAKTKGSGWVDYMWPKPGESVPTQKSAFVSRAMLDGKPLAVGAGVYLSDAPKAAPASDKMTAAELMALVREGAARFEKEGAKIYPEFRAKGSKWFRDDTYFIVYSAEGIRDFHAADAKLEGLDASGAADVLGRPYGRMFLDVASTPGGEGWIHYMYPEPGDIFPTWKSTFMKRVTLPSGKQYLIGSGIYNMEMDKPFIEDVVNRAAALIAERGPDAFPLIRDKTGPFVFMDTYVFVEAPDATVLVNAAQPSLEGKNLSDQRDVNGKFMVRDYIEAAMKNGSAWVEYVWYKPGRNDPALKRSFVRKVRHDDKTYVVGAGFYPRN